MGMVLPPALTLEPRRRRASSQAPLVGSVPVAISFGVACERIDTAAGLDAVDHLRYEAYLKEGAIEPNGDKRLVDAFDQLRLFQGGSFLPREIEITQPIVQVASARL